MPIEETTDLEVPTQESTDPEVPTEESTEEKSTEEEATGATEGAVKTLSVPLFVLLASLISIQLIN